MEKQVILIIELVGTKGLLDVPEKEYRVIHLEDAAERARQIVLKEGVSYKNYGWSVMKAVKRA